MPRGPKGEKPISADPADAYTLLLDVEHWNRVNPAEEPIQLPLDLTFDVYFRRSQTILLERERIKRKTIQNRRLLHHKQAA